MKMFIAIATLVLLCNPAHAQNWPAKPVTLLVPFPPGGSTDTVARALVPTLEEKFGQTFIVDNKAGATGTIGAAQVKRASADGYTFLVTSLGPLVIAPHLIKNVPYDAGKDFDYMTVPVQAPNVPVVPANSPHKSVADVISFQKANPNKMTFASSGSGSSDHLTAELFWLQARVTGVHVPYKGGAHGDLRSSRWPGRRVVPEHQRGDPAHQRRKAEGIGRDRRQAFVIAAQRAHACRCRRERRGRVLVARHRGTQRAAG